MTTAFYNFPPMPATSHLKQQGLESRLEDTRAGGEGAGGMGSYCLTGTEFQFGKTKSLEMGGGYGSTTM